jgi:RNA ligase (TIGR02306 family)
MSEFKVAFTKIKELQPHPDPETTSLEIATVYGFNVVVRKGVNNVGDFLLYIPVDSVLPEDFEGLIFGEGSKVKISNHRVRQIRLRKYPSQGMLVEVATVKALLEKRGLKSNMMFKLEHDYQELLGVHKYEPPVPAYITTRGQSRKERPLENALLHKYNGLENIKWFPDLFKEGEQVVIQEKLHGTNCRAGILPMVKPKFKHIIAELKGFNLRNAATLCKKFIRMTLAGKTIYEQVYGSNNVELTNRTGSSGFYGEDIYGAALARVKAFDKLQPNEVIYGEIIGEGVQKNYNYGHKEHHFVLFDVKVFEDGQARWLSPGGVAEFAKERGFDVVPTLYLGAFNKQLAYELTKGDSVYCPKQKIREGIVIKSMVNFDDKLCPGNKRALKWISEAYLDKDNTDFH